jgi:hypothetical protein
MSMLASKTRKKKSPKRSSKMDDEDKSKVDANDIYVRRTMVHRAIRKLRLEVRGRVHCPWSIPFPPPSAD